MVSRRKRANSSVGNKLNNLTDRVTEQQKLQQVSGTQTNAVTNDSIAPSSVNGESVADRAITSSKIGRGEVTSENLGVITEIVAGGNINIEAGLDGHVQLTGGKYEDPYDGITDGDGYQVVAFDPSDNSLKIIEASPPAESGLRFDTTYTEGSTAPGMLSWNDEDETLEVQVGDGEVTLQIGQETHVRVANNTGASILDGQVVYMFGGSDVHGHPYVAPYIADGTVSPFRVVGIATQTIASGAEGLVTVQGKVRGLDTSAYLAGDVLYASSTELGGYQTTIASAPNEIVSIGSVVNSDATDGEILVSVSPVLNQLQTNLVLFPTTVASDVGGYYRLVASTTDADYDVPAVDVSTGTLNSADDVLVGSLVADANLFVGSLGDVEVTVTGSIAKTSGNANTSAGFYFKVFKRDSGGTETLLGTSSVTSSSPLSESAPIAAMEFSASANVLFDTFTSTDRLVVKFYANTVEDGTQSYTFTYGGVSPVRILIPRTTSTTPLTTVPQSENYLLNGAFDIWQRGTSFGATDYTADRWYSVETGSINVSRYSASVPSVPTGIQYSMQVYTLGTSDKAEIYQPLETAVVVPLRGKTVTFSCYVKLDATMPGSLTMGAWYSNASDAYASQTTAVSTTTLTKAEYVGWTRATLTFTVPTDAVGMKVGFNPDALTPDATDAYYWLAAAQLELGAVATPFRRNSSSVQAELAACQRYYQRIVAGQLYSLFASGVFNTTTAFYMPMHLPVTLRSVPAFSWSGPMRVLTSGAGVVSTLDIYTYSATNPVSLAGTITGSTTDGQAGVLGSDNSTTSYLEFDSEL